MKELFEITRRDLKKGIPIFNWDPKSKYLAVCGANKKLKIYQRNGVCIHEHETINGATQLEWDKDGEQLAALIANSQEVLLFSVVNPNNITKKSLLTKVEQHNKKDKVDDPISFISWAKNGPHLAIGSTKGNLMLYNSQKSQKANFLGKASKKITIGAWNDENKLALAAADKTLTINNDQGDLEEQNSLKHEAIQMHWSSQKGQTTIAINMGRQSILIYNMAAPDENPVELAFRPKYGEITNFQWYGDGYIMAGFSKGFIVSISTHVKEVGHELSQVELQNIEAGGLVDVVCSQAANKIAVVDEKTLSFINMNDWKATTDDARKLTDEEGSAERLAWTEDGQILTMSTTGGYLINFLISVPTLAASYGPRLVYLSSLQEVSIFDASSVSTAANKIMLDTEPSFVALGPSQVAVGMNNHCWFYSTEPASYGTPIAEKEYLGTVDEMHLNDLYAAVRTNGKVHIHSIVAGEREDKLLPEEDDQKVVSVALTPEFLIYATDQAIHHFYLKEWRPINEYPHRSQIHKISPNPSGTRVLIMSENKAHMYSPVDDHIIDVPGFSPVVDTILWDATDPNVFIVVDSKATKNLTTYVYLPQTTKGPVIHRVGTTRIPPAFTSVLFHDGVVHGQKNADLSFIRLTTHECIGQKGRVSDEKLKQGLNQLLDLGKLKEAWEVAPLVKDKALYMQLSRKAMEQLDLQLAIRVFRELKDTAMVLALQEILHIEDKHLLAGHICLLEGEYTKAQDLFLRSTNPIVALQMRRDLLHWDHALKLASNLAPEELGLICREYGSSLEVKGEHKQALEMYERSLSEETPTNVAAEHFRLANAGIARTTLRLGELQKGKRLAEESQDPHLMRDCAAILESMKQYTDAAELYEKAKCYEKAAAIYILTKKFNKAEPLMSQITTPKLHAQYAKAKEQLKEYAAAAVAYEHARDMDSVIRLNLQHLGNAEKAFQIVRETKSSEGAALVATYCAEKSNFKTAIEFLLMAKRNDEAFQMAKGHGEMHKYAEALGDSGTTEDYYNIAMHYDEIKDFGNAGKFYGICNEYSKAIKFFLMCGTERIDDAIAIIKKADGYPGSEQLVRTLHDFLIGEVDGKVKDPNYIFRLYMAIGEYAQAAGTAILISTQEQKIGNYQVAHDILFETHQDLVKQKIGIPNDLNKSLLLLHSYTLSRKLIKSGDKNGAARMLIRVCKSISKFPSHIVQILTSTIIQCQKAGLKRSSYDHAVMLMGPNYRKSVDEKYRKRMEKIVRSKMPESEAEEVQSPCPFCGFLVPDSILDCTSCHNYIPYCITTGRHMVLDDWSHCPSCNFPTLYDSFYEMIKKFETCYMCGEKVKGEQIVKLTPDEAAVRIKNGGAEEENTETKDEGATEEAAPAAELKRKPKQAF